MVARDTGSRHSSFFSALGFSDGGSCGLNRTGSSSFSAKADTTYAAWTEMTAAQMRLDVHEKRAPGRHGHGQGSKKSASFFKALFLLNFAALLSCMSFELHVCLCKSWTRNPTTFL
jgi:hypothetical protein